MSSVSQTRRSELETSTTNVTDGLRRSGNHPSTSIVTVDALRSLLYITRPLYSSPSSSASSPSLSLASSYSPSLVDDTPENTLLGVPNPDVATLVDLDEPLILSDLNSASPTA